MAQIWVCLAAVHKKKLESVLDRGHLIAAKVPRRFPSRLLRSGLGARSLNDIVRHLASKFYVRTPRYLTTYYIAGLVQNVYIPCVYCATVGLSLIHI